MPPVIRSSSGGFPAKSSSSESSSSSDVAGRCQACWLKLCLIGYNLDADLYDRLRAHLPSVIRERLPEGGEQQRGRSGTLLPHRGEILEFNRQVPLSRPLFEGFGAVTTASSSSPATTTSSTAASADSSSPSSAQPSGIVAGSSAKSNHVVHERLPNGWTKKAVKRLEGELKGKWDTFLITPDQKMLKSPGDLKLYIAKSGAVVDSNIVNFSLPKKTAKVDKALQRPATKPEKKKAAAEVSESPNKTSPLSSPAKSASDSPAAREMRKLGFDEATKKTGNVTSMELPKTGTRRETKVPAKFRDYNSPMGKSARKKKEEGSKTSKTTKRALETKEEEDEDDNEDDVEEDSDEEAEDEEEEEEEKQPSPPLSLKKEKAPRRYIAGSKTLATTATTIGVGTFSIDKDSVKGKRVLDD